MSEAPQKWQAKLSNLGKSIALVVSIATGLSTAAGVVWSLYEFASAAHEKARAARIAQLTTFGSFGDLLENYREIEILTNSFIRTHRGTGWDFKALLEQHGTGASIYYSPEFEDYRKIQMFYEELGTLIRFKALDFEIVFQLMTFPSDFYEGTKPLQDFLSAHWYELRKDPAKRALKGFGTNLTQLAENYDRRRNDQPLQWDMPDL